MDPLDFIVIVGYLLLILYTGIRLSRRVANAHDYFLAGRSLPFLIVGLSIVGTNIGADSYIGASGNAFQIGIAQANFEWIGAIPAMIVASLIFIPLYWRAGVYSIPEYLGARYNQTVRVTAALITSVVAVFAIAVALWALALTLNTYLGWPPWVGIVVTAAVVGAYSIAGGLAAVAFTDALQVVIMFGGGLLILALGIGEGGGLAAFAEALTRDHPTHLQAYLPADHPSFPWPGVLLGLGVVLSPAYWCASQVILQRTLGARSQWDASAGMMFGALAKTMIPLLIVFPGLLALVMHAQIEHPDQAMGWVIRNVLPPGISGLMFVAVIAALQSTIDSGLNSTALMVTRDIRHVLMPAADHSRDLVVGRLVSLGILLAAAATAPTIAYMGGIYQFIQTVLSLFQGPMLALLILGAFTRWASPTAAVWTLFTGVAFTGLLLGTGMNMLYVAFYGFVYSVGLIAVVSWVAPAPANIDWARLTYRPWSRTA